LIGIALIIVGAVLWLVDYFGGEEGIGTGQTGRGAGRGKADVGTE
jgi:hypothetical protein